ncbi:MAG: TonB-dependent receptor, partial [Nevskia sp.]|nr:TonB-dependent receptor [Nevskia sp.]
MQGRRQLRGSVGGAGAYRSVWSGRQGAKTWVLMLVLATCAASSAPLMADETKATQSASPLADATAAPAADASNAGNPDSRNNAGTLQEVVVTAQKRKTKLQETPVAVTAFTAESIEQNHIQSLDDVALRAPSTTYVQLHKGETYISMRGTLINTPGAGWDDAVTTFIDDVPMTGVGDNSPDLFDLNSIEVLRGPQGTLFGRNVTGGALVIHTAPPQFKLNAKAEATYGLNNLAQFRGLVSGPLIGEDLAGKLTVTYKRRDDYVNNVTLHDKTFGDSVGNGRGQLLWEPREDLKVLFSGDFTRDTSSGKVVQLSGNLQPSLYPKLSYSPNDTNQGLNSTSNRNVGGSSARVDWDLSWATLTSISGFRRVHDGTTWSRLGDPDNQAPQTAVVQDKQYTEEIHLASPYGQKFTWLGGLFYMHANKQEDDQYGYNLNSGSANAAQFPVPIKGVAQAVDQQVRDDDGALFGEASYPIIDALKFTIGGRGQWEAKQGFSTIANSFAPGNPYAVAYPLIFHDANADYSRTWWSFTPKATLSYQVDKGLMAYLTVAKGYKSGGWDTSAASDFGKSSSTLATALSTPFEPERVWSYELGTKFISSDRRLQANLAAFIAHYTDMQTNRFNPQTLVFETTNAGSAQAKGVELETTAAPTRWLTLGLNYAYDFARYTNYIQSSTQNNTDDRIPETPRHNIHVSAETKFAALLLPGSLNFGGDYTYRTKVYFSDSNAEPAFIQQQSKFDGIVNMHLIWNSVSNKWHATLFGT